jgi:hypothetical protein
MALSTGVVCLASTPPASSARCWTATKAGSVVSPRFPKADCSDLVSDTLVERYRIGEAAHDGLPGTEGTFSVCSFWLVEALARSGHLEEAQLLFEKMLTYANHLGLFAEEIASSGEALGNFPQAFTHLGLISAAVNLNSLLDDPEVLDLGANAIFGRNARGARDDADLPD